MRLGLRGWREKSAGERPLEAAAVSGPDVETRTCSAPSAALYLRPDGLVMACCSAWHVLGSVTGPDRRSLIDIWHGDERQQLRATLDRGSFELGCYDCKGELRTGQGAATLARAFDRYGPGPRAFPAMIDFAMSDRCNLQCVQCSGTFSSAIRRHREGRAPLAPAYDDQFFEELDEFLPHLERAQFKGGEPFLMRENRRVWDRLLALGSEVEATVTTNGTIWNAQVERYTEELAFEVIVSVDAVDPGRLEAIRVGTRAEQLWKNVDRFRSVTNATGRTLTLSFCLMSINWQELGPFLRACDRLGANPDVIWVGGPGNFNLLTMVRRDLLEVLAAYERDDAHLGDLGPATRPLWENALDRVRAAATIDRTDGGVAVTLGRRVASPASFEDRIAAAVAELGTSDATSLLRLDYVQEVLCSVQAPPWSAWLEPDAWLGVGLRETMTTIGAAGTGSMRSEVDAVEGGAHRLRLTFESDRGTRTLRGLSVPDPDDAGSITILFAEASAS